MPKPSKARRNMASRRRELVLTAPPPDPPPKSKWRQRWDAVRRRIFTPVKIPAWFLILWGLFQGIPDWDGRIHWWLETTQKAGGVMGAVAGIVGAPAFQALATGCALVWLIFVGEPEKHVRRDHRLRYVGWAIVVVFFLAVFLPTGYGAFELAVQQAANAREVPYSPWRLSDDQQNKLGEFLDKQSSKFPIRIESLQGSTQSQSFGLSLLRALGAHQWPAQWLIDPGLRPDIVGVSIGIPVGVDLSVGPHETLDVTTDMLHILDIYPGIAGHGNSQVGQPGIDKNTVWIVVGNKP
jgi:hypothetical protein